MSDKNNKIGDTLRFTGAGENKNPLASIEGGLALWQRVVAGLHPDEDNSAELETQVLRLIRLAPVVGDTAMDLYTRLEPEIQKRMKNYYTAAEALHDLLDEYRM